MVNLHEATTDGRLDAEIAVVVASREGGGAERARERGIPTETRHGVMTSCALDDLVGAHRLDWIVLAGYLKLLPITEKVRGRVVNILPALLPAHGGPGMHGDRVHRAVLDAGDTQSGCTVHLCDDRYDTGPILAQATCPVREDDTVRTLAERVFALELELYPETLQRLVTGEIGVAA